MPKAGFVCYDKPVLYPCPCPISVVWASDVYFQVYFHSRQLLLLQCCRRELACARIAAALSSTSDCLSTGLLQLRNWVQYQKDQEAEAAEAEAAEAAEAARAEYAAAEAEAAAAETQRLEILERFASSLCRALQQGAQFDHIHILQ